MTVHQKSAPLTDRQAAILALVEENGYVTIEALAAQYGLSAQTVRRDIIAMSEAGRLQRFHGGAGLAEQGDAARLDYRAKREMSGPEKRTVGRNAAALIPDGASLYLDVGTTIEACAEHLSRRAGFTVVTNSMPAAMKFDPRDHQVFVLGGRMAGRDGSLVGPETMDKLQELNLDYALIACSAIDAEDRVMDYDMTKISIKRAAMTAARHSMLLATRNKFNRTALAVIAPKDRFDTVVTEVG